MSEKIEFIPAKDLPVAEGDEVDVLCMENGELKRKEGASLGGGGGYDMVIACDKGFWDATTDNFSFVSGTVAGVIAKLQNLEPVNIAVVTTEANFGSYSGQIACYPAVSISTAGEGGKVCIRFLVGDLYTYATKTYSLDIKDDAGENLVWRFEEVTA